MDVGDGPRLAGELVPVVDVVIFGVEPVEYAGPGAPTLPVRVVAVEAEAGREGVLGVGPGAVARAVERALRDRA